MQLKNFDLKMFTYLGGENTCFEMAGILVTALMLFLIKVPTVLAYIVKFTLQMKGFQKILSNCRTLFYRKECEMSWISFAVEGL